MTRKLPQLNTLNPYESTLPFKNGHIDTIIPALFRKNHHVKYERFRIITRDDDFLDLDFSINKNKKNSKLIILSHGLESSSNANYIKGMIKLFEKNDFDALAWNCRGCSGETNLKEFYYHSGFTQDLDEVINYAQNIDQYSEIYLIGFSMGGNLTLKYLGEKSKHISSKIKRACVFSTP